MNIEIHVCSTYRDLVTTVAALPSHVAIIYQTLQTVGGETGDIEKYDVPAQGPKATLANFSNKYVLIVRN